MKSLAPRADTYLETSLRGKISEATARLSPQMQWRAFIVCLIVADGMMVGLAFWLAYVFRFNLSLAFFQLDVIPSFSFYRNLTALFLIPLWLVIFAIVGLYRKPNLLGGTQEYAMVFRATTVSFVAVVAAGFLEPDLVIARGWLLLAWFFTFVSAAVARFWIRRAVYYLREHGYFLAPAVIVGANQEGRWLAEQLLTWKTSGLHVVGFVDEKVAPGTVLFRNLQALGTVDQLDKIIEQHKIEELILATSAISSRNKMLEIFQRYGTNETINIRMSSGLYEIVTTGLTVKEFAYVPLVGVNKVRLTGVDELMKFLLDYAVAITALIMIAPLLLMLAIVIRLDSPGPVVHRRRVMGVNGKQFDAYKFRTMYINGDEILNAHPRLKAELARNHKLKDDPRITRIGKMLRKYSLDELPQVFNVFKREMSLVGPRMISPKEMEEYNQWGINLLTVKPGITGLWQVSGRSDVSYEERVRLDMYYVRNWTIWLDLQILLQTPWAVIRGRGAY